MSNITLIESLPPLELLELVKNSKKNGIEVCQYDCQKGSRGLTMVRNILIKKLEHA